MTIQARRLQPLAVLFAGLLAAAAAVMLFQRSRRAESAHVDRDTTLLLSAALDARMDALFRSVRGPAQAFDLGTLEPREISGVLRLAYTQNPEVTAVTIVDERGTAVVPAVFLTRGAMAGNGRAVESFDDLDRFARAIPFDAARVRGRAVRGPYASLRGDGARFVIAESVPVSEGTHTWVLAAEIDAAHLLDGLGHPVTEAAIAIMNDGAMIQGSSRASDDVRHAVESALRARRIAREPIVLRGSDWHAEVMSPPAGLEGALVVAWSGDNAAAQRTRQTGLALGMLIMTIIGALAVASFITSRDTSGPRANTPSMHAEARVLASVVKELANPIAATVAAAQLIANEPGRGRLAETLQRSAQRVQRAFRRVSRLTRAGEEVVRARVDLASITRREVDALRAEAGSAREHLSYEGPNDGVMVKADEDDIALLVQSLVEAARALAPGGSAIKVAVEAVEEQGQLVVSDAGAMRAAERQDATALERASRSGNASPALALTLVARIAEDHRARFDLVDRIDGPGCAAMVTFGGEARSSIAPSTGPHALPNT